MAVRQGLWQTGRGMQEGKRFKVVAADARPHLEGKVLRQRLIKHGIACTYILLNGLACIIGVREHALSLCRHA